MRNCSKCGSYVPEGKKFCVACGRPAIGAAETHRERISQERSRTHTRISDARKEVGREAWTMPRGNHPYAGNTYEQHKSHDPRSRDYYKSKYEATSLNQYERIICALAYFSIFFFLPLVLLPNSKAGRFHANQGLVLFLANILLTAFNIGLSVFGIFLMAYGVYNALQGKMQELPVIGKFRLIQTDGGQPPFGGRR